MRDPQTIHQKPRPRILIKSYNNETEAVKTKYEFSLDKSKVIQSYSFSYSLNSVDGSFSITFYPDSEQGKSIIDEISILDVVEIYEDSAAVKNTVPSFIGVIKSKKFVGQMSDSGLTRRLSISGIGITGLVSQFYLSLDAKACAMRDIAAENSEISKKLTIDIAAKTSIAEIVKTIWEHFIDISTKYNNVGNVAIKDMLTKFIGDTDSIFAFSGDLPVKYAVGCVFDGESTQDFYSVIDRIIPRPYYEKFAYLDSNGKQRIKIRIAPFDPAKWNKLPIKNISPVLIKNLSIELTDSEVYTAFYAYILNSPMEEDKQQMLSTQLTGESAASFDDDKYKIYGYRLLSAHFLGYVKPDNKDDLKTSDYLNAVIEQMKDWYGRIDEMYSGTLTLVTEYGKGQTNFINPGDRISVFGAEFYVEGVTHNWSFGQSGETSLSVSRGGKYTGGVFSHIPDISAKMTLLQG